MIKVMQGVRVLEVAQFTFVPAAGAILADWGADVIKVEPPDGDETRAWGPPWWGDPAERRSAYFASVNRNKRSVVLDLRTDDGRAALDRLLETADLLVAGGAAVVGIDAVNIDGTADAARPIHTILLGAGVPIVEHLTGLGRLAGARFTFSAVPPAIVGLGTFPVRAYAVVDP